MQDFKVFSLDVIERAGFKFKVSANNADGGVIIFTTNDVFRYTAFKSFSSAAKGREWVDNLVLASNTVCKDLFKDE